MQVAGSKPIRGHRLTSNNIEHYCINCPLRSSEVGAERSIAQAGDSVHLVNILTRSPRYLFVSKFYTYEEGGHYSYSSFNPMLNNGAAQTIPAFAIPVHDCRSTI